MTQESEIYKYLGKHVGNIVTESQTATVLCDVWGCFPKCQCLQFPSCGESCLVDVRNCLNTWPQETDKYGRYRNVTRQQCTQEYLYLKRKFMNVCSLDLFPL